MHSTRTRLTVTVFVSWIACGAAAVAQAQRPLATRAVPIDVLCGPQAALTPPSRAIRITGGTERMKGLFAPGDAVTIGAGTTQGIAVGQHYYVRRVVEDRFTVRTTDKQPVSIHTAGWLTITEATETTAVARVSEACDGIEPGDYLEPLVLAPPAAAIPSGEPDFARPARVILADDRRQLGAGGGSMMVIDRGSDHGLRPGQRLTIFRPANDGSGPAITIGDAVVSSTQFESSLIRIGKSKEAIQVGDLVAIHR